MEQQNRQGGEAPSKPPYIDRGSPLPQSYAENNIVAMVRDPDYLFAYWDVETEVRVACNRLLIRVHCLSDVESYDIEPSAETDNWHLQVAPNRTYQLELYARLASGELRFLAKSDEVTTPLRLPGESGAELPAEVIHARRHPMVSGEPAARPDIALAETPGLSPTPVAAPTDTTSERYYSRGTES